MTGQPMTGQPMTPDQVEFLRRLALKDREAMDLLMTGELVESGSLDARTMALVRITALLSVDSDITTFQWATEIGLAAGLNDGDVFDALVVAAPMIGMARLASALPRLMAALRLDIIEG